MKNATIAWILVVVFFTTSVLFAGLYLSARHTLQRTQTALDMTEKSEAELRDNVQAAVVQSDKTDKAEAVLGIYKCEADTVVDGRLDLRSDGTAVLSRWTGSRWYALPKTRWKLDDNKVTVGTQAVKIFTIEQDDFIDSRGNRWIHTR
jgi:hypothetical protein